MRSIASVWRAYRRRRLRTQVLIAGLVVLLAAAATGQEAPAGRTDLVIERPSESEPAGRSTTTSEMTTPPRTTESTSAPSTSTTEGGSSADGGGDGAGTAWELSSVTKHVDGDTLWVSGGEKVRFIGMDTPETYGRTDCYGPEASARTAELLPLGTEVRLVFDAGRHDRYGRTLAYVYRTSDGLFVNASLLRDGYAQVMTVPPNVVHAEEFLALQREAREAGRGFWGACGSSPVAPASVPTTTVAPATTVPIRPLAGGGCHPSYAGTCIPPDVSDADCAGGSGDGPHYVQEKDVKVVGSDPYRLDSNGDGVGCES